MSEFTNFKGNEELVTQGVCEAYQLVTEQEKWKTAKSKKEADYDESQTQNGSFSLEQAAGWSDSRLGSRFPGAGSAAGKVDWKRNRFWPSPAWLERVSCASQL